MSGVSISYDLSGIVAVDALLDRLDPLDGAELLEAMARLVQGQTRRRIYSEKTGPDGTAWPPNRKGTSILVASEALAKSIDYKVNGTEAIVGSGLRYSRIHQFGGVIRPKAGKALAFKVGGRKVVARKVTIPARPYLGVSDANAVELLDTAVRFMRDVIGR
ncbi:phage virion morphogenesis protein [uncultured Methylobacterium sp.]|uniref:phage virion morphogenesis protein n=1 Tax=uncultured Methylobacterium sp. TaxID=157278 RepID=UPI0035CA46E4